MRTYCKRLCILSLAGNATFVRMYFCTFSCEDMQFCTFPFLAVMADTTRLAGPSRICKSAKLQLCIFALLHFQLGELAQLAMQNCKNATTCKNTNFALFHFFWYGWHGQSKDVVAGTSRICKSAKVHFCAFVWYGWHGWNG